MSFNPNSSYVAVEEWCKRHGRAPRGHAKEYVETRPITESERQELAPPVELNFPRVHDLLVSKEIDAQYARLRPAIYRVPPKKHKVDKIDLKNGKVLMCEAMRNAAKADKKKEVDDGKFLNIAEVLAIG